jgi:hypothetical protein
LPFASAKPFSGFSPIATSSLLYRLVLGYKEKAIMVQMSQKEQDIQMMLAAGCHLGTKNVNFQMERYGACERFFFPFFGSSRGEKAPVLVLAEGILRAFGAHAKVWGAF